MSAAAACALVVFGAASASAAKPVLSGGHGVSFGSSAAAVADGGWGAGVEAALPANAAVVTGLAEIVSVSCASAGNCSAVGTYIDSSDHNQGLLLTETAGRWAPGVEAILPANGASHYSIALDSVSCASAGNCSAVGNYEDSSGWHGLLLTETAGSWAPGVDAAQPGGASHYWVELDSVSCASAGNCSAVGSYQDSLGWHGLLLTETAGSWAPGVEAVLPSNAGTTGQGAVLKSVSCASAGNCSAVGLYDVDHPFDPEGVGKGLLLTETAGTWAPGVEAALPANAAAAGQVVGLSSVSCAEAGNCSAVGTYSDSSGWHGLLLTETAGSWAPGVEAVPPANAAGFVELSSVSCASAGNCSAVGRGLLLTETAGSWAPGVEATLPANSASNDGGELDSVSCASAGNCSAVGTYSDSSGNFLGLLLTETAGSWATGVELSLPPNATPDRYGTWLGSVSCPSAGTCSAGGRYPALSSGGLFHGALLIGGSPAAVKVDISKKGTGSGAVSSLPAGIDCGSTCSASFDAGSSLTLVARPSARSYFSGWTGGGCPGFGRCRLNTGISEQTVTATFGPLPCLVPNLEGKTLKAAKHALGLRHCSVGKIKHAASQTIKKGHVVSQRPKPGRLLKYGARVNLVVSKGTR